MEQNSSSHSAAYGPENKRRSGENAQQSSTGTGGRQGQEDSNQDINRVNGDDNKENRPGGDDTSSDRHNIAGGYDDNYDDQDRNEDQQGNYNYGANQDNSAQPMRGGLDGMMQNNNGRQGDDNLNQSPAQDNSRNDSSQTDGQNGQRQDNDYENGHSYTGRNA